jgi:hypothetical protein
MTNKTKAILYIGFFLLMVIGGMLVAVVFRGQL